MRKTKYQLLLFGAIFLFVGISLLTPKTTFGMTSTTPSVTGVNQQWHQVESWSLNVQTSGGTPPIDIQEPDELDNPYLIYSAGVMAGMILLLIADNLKYSKLPKPVKIWRIEECSLHTL